MKEFSKGGLAKDFIIHCLITIAIIVLFLLPFHCFAQQLQIQGDSAIVLIENNRKVLIDSATIENQINRVRQEVKRYDDLILQTKAAKSDKQSTLTYFLEIRNKYWAIKRTMKNKKG